jgi:hypothetical protein
MYCNALLILAQSERGYSTSSYAHLHTIRVQWDVSGWALGSVCIFRGQENFSFPGDLTVLSYPARILITKLTELLQLRTKNFKGLKIQMSTALQKSLADWFFTQYVALWSGAGGSQKIF